MAQLLQSYVPSATTMMERHLTLVVKSKTTPMARQHRILHGVSCLLLKLLDRTVDRTQARIRATDLLSLHQHAAAEVDELLSRRPDKICSPHAAMAACDLSPEGLNSATYLRSWRGIFFHQKNAKYIMLPWMKLSYFPDSYSTLFLCNRLAAAEIIITKLPHANDSFTKISDEIHTIVHSRIHSICIYQAFFMVEYQALYVTIFAQLHCQSQATMMG